MVMVMEGMAMVPKFLHIYYTSGNTVTHQTKEYIQFIITSTQKVDNVIPDQLRFLVKS